MNNKRREELDRLDVRQYKALAAEGHRLPRTRGEVKAAEEWLKKNPVTIPEKLRAIVGINPSRASVDRALDNRNKEERDISRARNHLRNKDLDRDDR